MQVYNYMDIKYYVENEIQNCNYATFKLKKLSKNPFKKNRIEREKIKEQLEEIRKNIDYYEKLVDGITTFKRKELLSFFVSYLSLTENKEIIVSKLVEDEDISSGFSMLTTGIMLQNVGLLTTGIMNMLDEDDEKYYLISTEEDSKKIKKKFKSYDIGDAIKKSGVEQCFFVSKKKIHLADGLKIKEKYLCFPELQNAFERLIDLALQDSTLSEKDRLNIVLDETIENMKTL